MQVIARRTLRDFWEAHPEAEAPLRARYAGVEKADWTGPKDIRSQFGSADFVADNRVISNIGGNKFRLVVHVAYPFKRVLVKFIGTHKQYDDIRPGDGVMDIRPIRNEEDYDWALAEITHYFDNQPEPGTPEADRFDVLAGLIGAYEDKHWPIEAPNPVEAIKAYMAFQDRNQSDLAELLDSKSRASEVLNYKRPLSLDMVHRLSSKWHIPAEILIVPYHLERGEKPATPKKRGAKAKHSARAA